MPLPALSAILPPDEVTAALMVKVSVSTPVPLAPAVNAISPPAVSGAPMVNGLLVVMDTLPVVPVLVTAPVVNAPVLIT